MNWSGSGSLSVMGSSTLYVLMCTFLFMPTPNQAARILLYPYNHGYTSRLADVLKMGHLLHDHGHQVAFLINDDDRKHVDSVPGAIFHTFPAPTGRFTLMENEDMKSELMRNPGSNDQVNSLAILVKNHQRMCRELLGKEGFLAELKAAQYDLFILDALDSCGRILTQFLDIPTMGYSSTGFIYDYASFPNLPSFLPTPLTGFTNNMNFFERVANTFLITVLDWYMQPIFYDVFEQFKEEYGLQSTNPEDLRRCFVDQIHLVHADFALEYPRPLLPNVVLIGGVFVPTPRPLGDDLEQFMAEAGKNGVVIVSFGSLIKKMDPVTASIIARALAKLQQRVIWRYAGSPPEGVGANTRLLSWLPQNDLLAHPQTRLFVTHCGIHGTYETAWHGVPVVAVPLMFDQKDNAAKLVGRAEMGVLVDFKTISEESLGVALREVLFNPVYKENAMETARMLRDHPQTPQERFIYWVEKVIRNKGIGKLTLEPLKHMSMFELYGIDVWLFIGCITLVLLMALAWCLRLCLRLICKTISVKRQKAKKL